MEQRYSHNNRLINMNTKNKMQNGKRIMLLSIFVIVLLIIFCSGMVKSALCYQETANESHASDGDCSLDYSGLYLCSGDWNSVNGCNKTYDGNWSSYGGTSGGIPGSTGDVYINYTKPSGALNSSLWRASSPDGQENLTIPSSVWDQDTLQFKVTSLIVGASAGNYWYGRNETGWVTIWSNTFEASPLIYEEAMWWNVTSDTCTYGGSGDWIVDASDNCSITTNTNLPSNTLYIEGTGTFTILANITVDKVVMDLNAQIINKAGDGNALIIKL